MLLIGLAVLVTIIVVFTIVIVYNNRIVYEKTFKVKAQVTDMYCLNGHFAEEPADITDFDALYFPEEYCVTLTYKKVSQTFSNPKLYHSVIVGAFVPVILYCGYNKKKNLIWQELRLPD